MQMHYYSFSPDNLKLIVFFKKFIYEIKINLFTAPKIISIEARWGQ